VGDDQELLIERKGHVAVLTLNAPERLNALSPHLALGSLAHAYAADAYVRIAGDAVLVHGAIGFTWEHDLHRYLKRAMVNRQLAGTTSAHRDRHLSIKLAATGRDR
jgi:alkylation response protein AidB-like acyl-CoA dehydrogenase